MVRNIANFSHQSLLLCLLLVLLPNAAVAQMTIISLIGFDLIRFVTLLTLGAFHTLIPLVVLCKLRTRAEAWPEWVKLTTVIFCVGLIACLPMIIDFVSSDSVRKPLELHKLPVMYSLTLEGDCLIFAPYFMHKYLQKKYAKLRRQIHTLIVSMVAILTSYVMVRIVEIHAAWMLHHELF